MNVDDLCLRMWSISRVDGNNNDGLAATEVAPPLDATVVSALTRIGANVKRARKEAFHESRVAFARRIGCAPMTLDRIERGDFGVAAGHLLSALHHISALEDVVDKTNPGLLIAALVPASFPAGFPVEQPKD